MRLLHTSDWHLGRALYGKQRLDEFSKFLNWLQNCIISQNIDVLIISGDVFDTTTPGNRAQELYYQFLFNVSNTNISHVVITSGNHDSPSFLSAPKEILKHINIHIVTSGNSIEDEVLELKNSEGNTELIVCAVPYLKDRDIRTVESGESIDDKNLKLSLGIKNHYKEVCELAKSINTFHVPIVAMGHLFATGGKTVDNDGVRELYVGSLSRVGIDIFPNYINYVALGHLHIPQKLGNKQNVRYSGSPIPMGFGEANQEKQVVIVDFIHNETLVKELKIPCFQELKRISGTKEKILEEIISLKKIKSEAWLEIEVVDEGPVIDLQEDLLKSIDDSYLEIRIIKNSALARTVLNKLDFIQNLEELTTREVFEKCLELNSIDNQKHELLFNLFFEIEKEIMEEDCNL